LAETEEKYLTPAEETEVERKRRKVHKRKAMSRFNVELSRQVDDEVSELSRSKHKRRAVNSPSKHSR